MGRGPTYPDEEFIDAVEQHELATVADVAETVGCSHRTATRRLRELAENGRLRREEAGGAFVYFTV